MKNYLIAFLLLIVSNSYSQQSTFQLQAGIGTNVSLPGNIQNTFDGGFIACGTASQGNLVSPFLLKLSATGSVQWKIIYDAGGLTTSGNYVIQTSDSGYLLVGNQRITTQNEEIIAIRTDANGNQLWSKTYGNNANDYGNSVIELPSGNFIISGVSVISTSRAAILRIDSSGTLLTSNFCTSVYASPRMKARLTGSNQLSITGTFVTEIMTDTSGLYTGQVNVQLAGSGNSSDALVTPSGKHISAGTMDIGAPTGEKIALTGSDALGSPSTLWSNKFGFAGANLAANALLQANDGGFVVSGVVASFGSGSGLLLMKTDSVGNFEAGMRYHPANGSEYYAGGAIKTPDGGYALSGVVYFGTTSNFVIIKTDSSGFSGCNETPITLTSATALTSTPNLLGQFAGSLSNTGTTISLLTSTTGTTTLLCSNTTGSELFPITFESELYPNPFTNQLAINIASSTHGLYELKIYNVSGKLLMALKSDRPEWHSNEIEKLVSGIYIAEVFVNDYLLSRTKLVRAE